MSSSGSRELLAAISVFLSILPTLVNPEHELKLTCQLSLALTRHFSIAKNIIKSNFRIQIINIYKPYLADHLNNQVHSNRQQLLSYQSQSPYKPAPKTHQNSHHNRQSPFRLLQQQSPIHHPHNIRRPIPLINPRRRSLRHLSYPKKPTQRFPALLSLEFQEPFFFR